MTRDLPDLAIAVGEFRDLVVWAEADPRRCDSVRKMLKLTKGWEEAREHALRVRLCARCPLLLGLQNTL